MLSIWKCVTIFKTVRVHNTLGSKRRKLVTVTVWYSLQIILSYCQVWVFRIGTYILSFPLCMVYMCKFSSQICRILFADDFSKVISIIGLCTNQSCWYYLFHTSSKMNFGSWFINKKDAKFRPVCFVPFAWPKIEIRIKREMSECRDL